MAILGSSNITTVSNILLKSEDLTSCGRSDANIVITLVIEVTITTFNKMLIGLRTVSNDGESATPFLSLLCCLITVKTWSYNYIHR